MNLEPRWQSGIVAAVVLLGVAALWFGRHPKPVPAPAEQGRGDIGTARVPMPEQAARTQPAATLAPDEALSRRLTALVTVPEDSPATALEGEAAVVLDSSELEALIEQDPERALQRILSERPADVNHAQRLKALEVSALVGLGRIGSARTQTGVYYERWPDGPDVRLLEQLTGLHPTPREPR